MRGAGGSMDSRSGGPHHPPSSSASLHQWDTREPVEALPVLRDSSQLPGQRTQILEAAQEVVSGIHQGMSVLGVRQSAARGLPMARSMEQETVRQADIQTLDQALAEIQRLRAALAHYADLCVLEVSTADPCSASAVSAVYHAADHATDSREDAA